MSTLNINQRELIVSASNFISATANNILNGRFRHIINDIHQETFLAACKATLCYDPASGVQYTSFLYPHIVYAIQRSVREYGFSVHIPQHAESLVGIVRLQMDLDDDGNSPDEEILADLYTDDTDTMELTAEQDKTVGRLLARLTKTELCIVRRFFGFDGKEMTIPAIAKSMKMTPRQVRKIYNEAIIKMEKQ